MLLQVKESGGPLDISQRFRPGYLLPFEYLTAADRPLELPDELLQVMLHDPVQIDQVAVNVVYYLGLRR